MKRFKPTPELIEMILTRVPEGFIRLSALSKRVKTYNSSRPIINRAMVPGKIERNDELVFDRVRLTLEQAEELARWCRPFLPKLTEEGTVEGEPILERINARAAQIAAQGDPIVELLMQRISQTVGYIEQSVLAQTPTEENALEKLIVGGMLAQTEDLVYDPLRLSSTTMSEVRRLRLLAPMHLAISDFLAEHPGQTAPMDTLVERFGSEVLRDVLNMGGFGQFRVPTKKSAHEMTWVRLKGSSEAAAREVAHDAVKIKDDEWEAALLECGEGLRPGARDGKTRRIRVIARSYTLSAAAKRLGIREATLDAAVREGRIAAFFDPEGRQRLPADEVEAAFEDSAYLEEIASFEVMKPRDLALVAGISYPSMRDRMRKANISRSEPTWRDVRGRWNLPATLREFREQLDVKMEMLKSQREAQIREQQALVEEQQRLTRAQVQMERQRRESLRERLVAAFPTWQHEGRAEQRIMLHVGPPNSGKTHDCLEALVKAGSGWYLAPLRLLAFEVFDRLNQRGVPCNLLTGEEYIPVDGALITAATIEMFNPNHSGECIVIDEAQMLADPDRGWAWTRALMEAQAPEIRVISPPTAERLIHRMASAAAIPIGVIQHERLAPIQVAARPWSLRNLPPRTILVAFSRQTVLELKTDLEQMKRTVSVVYGNLPPEVRRRQADRFAEGQTEICVATDAVGMGLNLPADYVCFYETQKFDGQRVRELKPSEVQQIGGRAGRFGLSTVGEVGATNKQNLDSVRRLFNTPPENLKHARVAPSVEDLEMIPGSLAERLIEWSALKSIPDSLRGALNTADMKERIELARMLSDEEIAQLGLASAVKLVNAPTRQSTRAYWLSCARALIQRRPLPMPPVAPKTVADGGDLELAETCISCADIYLWLANRGEFRGLGKDEQEVRHLRVEWSAAIDAALLRRIDTARRCANCRRVLPRGYRYSLCDNCYYERTYAGDFDYDFQ